MCYGGSQLIITEIELRTRAGGDHLRGTEIRECVRISNESECATHLSLGVAIFTFGNCGPGIYV